jgi:hypothetical protein
MLANNSRRPENQCQIRALENAAHRCSSSLAGKTVWAAIAALISVFMCVDLSAPGAVPLESDSYSINQYALTHSDPVAFSIGYPKGWTKSENTTVVSDNLGDLASFRDHELVCTFASPLDPIDTLTPRMFRIVTNYASITIFRSYSASAKEEAENFAAHIGRMSDEAKSLTPIRTKAGDPGYLLISDDETPNGHKLRSELFFHVGNKGHIRISICVMGTLLGMHERLQKLVLESLRFPGG